MESKELRYPVTSANFKWIREQGMLYVDKTAYIGSLLDLRNKYFFLARPRRFGKSLFLDTLQEYFSANRPLFKGLDIDRHEPGEWKRFPVLRFDLSGNAYLQPENLTQLLHIAMARHEEDYGLRCTLDNISDRFEQLIFSVAKVAGNPVVILVDEYDSPLASTIDRPELHELFRDQLRGFYSVLKKMESHIRFCFLTGVTRYGKVSVFSGLNNLKDLTFDDRFAGICGVTEEELHRFYDEGVKQFATNRGLTVDEVYTNLKYHYDGYHFTECMLDVYNPYSLNHALDEQKIKDYWFESGSPAVFLKLLMKMDYDLEKLNGVEVTESELAHLGEFTTDPAPLFFQTGYLTLKHFDSEDQLYTLGYPNREVENALLRNVLAVYTEVNNLSRIVAEMKKSLREGNAEKFVNCLKTYFANIPSDLKEKVAKYERYYQTVIYCLMTLIGLETRAEYGVAGGYIDLVIQTPDYVYIIELKVNGTAEEAMGQIERKGYCDPFALDSRKLIRIALGFSKSAQNIATYLID